MSKSIICVVGATGNQGGSVVDALLEDGKWSIRAVSRDPNSEKAKKLTERNVEVVKADTGDKESLVAAFKGCKFVFGVTSFWDPSVATAEEEHGKNLVDAAKEAQVEHFIFSSLPDPDKLSGGRHKVIHFTMKAEVEAYARQSGIPHVYFPAPAFYMQNLYGVGAQVDEDGVVNFALALLPNTKLSMVDITDMGRVVREIVNNPSKWDGQFVALEGSYLTLEEISKTYSAVTGSKTRFTNVPTSVLASQGGRAAAAAEMFDWFNDKGYFGDADTQLSSKLLDKPLTTFAEWIQKTGFRAQKK